LSYQYWVIRYVPNLVRGEFTNIGIVCGRDGKDWAVEFDTRAVDNHGPLGRNLPQLQAWVRNFSGRVENFDSVQLEGDPLTTGWLERQRARQANSIQFSEPRSIVAASAAEAVSLLYPLLVERDVSRSPRGLTRASMRAGVRDLLKTSLGLVVGRDLFVQPYASVGRQRTRFDLFQQDHSAGQLAQVWTFNVVKVDSLEQDIQATNYFMTRLRHDGASLDLHPGKAPHLIPADTPMRVIYDPPVGGSGSAQREDIFGAALEAWDLNDVTTVSYDEFRAKYGPREQETVGSY